MTDDPAYRDDPDLGTMEKEVSITFARDEDRAHVHAEISSVVKWLDNHPEFETEDVRRHDGNIVALTGTLPVGCLHLKGKSRKQDTAGRITGSLDVKDGGDA